MNTLRRPLRIALMLIILMLPLSALAGPGTRGQAGIHGTLYVSPSYPFSLVWDDDIWSPDGSTTNGETDQLDLLSPWSRLSVVLYSDTGSHPIDCARDAVDRILTSTGTHRLIVEPVSGNGYAAGSVQTHDSSQPDDVTRDITCIKFADDLPYMILVTHSVWTSQYDAVRRAAQDIIGSIRPVVSAPTQAVTSTPQATPAGLLEVDLQRIPDPEWPAPLNPSYEFLTIQLIVENVDQIPSFFDLRNVRIDGVEGSAQGYAWMQDTGGSSEPSISVAPGETAIARLIFVIPADSNPMTPCYQVRASCLELGTLGMGGGGIRPRINPG